MLFKVHRPFTLYKPVSSLRVEHIMTPTLMMALPPKKLDICTMILFQGELAASTEVSLAPDAQKGPLSLPLTTPATHTFPYTSLPWLHVAVIHLHCHLPMLLPVSGLTVQFEVLGASDLGSLSRISKVTIKTVSGMILLKLCSDHTIH